MVFFQTSNFDLKRSYLDLVTMYVCIMVLVSNVDDRKVVLSLYNVAHEYLHGSHELTGIFSDFKL